MREVADSRPVFDLLQSRWSLHSFDLNLVSPSNANYAILLYKYEMEFRLSNPMRTSSTVNNLVTGKMRG